MIKWNCPLLRRCDHSTSSASDETKMKEQRKTKKKEKKKKGKQKGNEVGYKREE